MKQPLAYVHPEAQIADNVVIEPFVTIDKNVVIEEGTRIGSNVTILEGAHIGKNCKIFPGAVISAIPQDLKFKGEKTIVEIGDNTTIRECATINRGTAAKGVTKVGSNCLIMAYVHIAHDCEIGDNCIITNACQLAGEVVVDDFAIIGGMSAVHTVPFRQFQRHRRQTVFFKETQLIFKIIGDQFLHRVTDHKVGFENSLYHRIKNLIVFHQIFQYFDMAIQ